MGSMRSTTGATRPVAGDVQAPFHQPNADCKVIVPDAMSRVVPSTQTVADYIAQALAGRETGAVMPFATEVVATGEVIGSTRFWEIDRKNRKLEIGSTWLAARWQGTYANTKTKHLMFKHAFETLDCVRVQFTTHEMKARSRAAILRLGAQQEGIVRRERIMPNGRKRNSVRFSIIDDEWPQVKAALERLIHGP